MNDEQKDVNVNFLEVWRTEVIRAYETSGLFAAVKSGTDPADIYADVKIIDKGEASMGMAVLTGLTLYLIPSKAHECFTMKTTYKDKNGTALGSADKMECFDFWQQLFLLPAMCKRSINPILLFGRWRPKRLGLDVERQQRLDLFEGLGLGQLGE
ncbi:MAG: hypothetical protein ACREXX_22905, partial [Gammaproteobacteria bacterium]